MSVYKIKFRSKTAMIVNFGLLLLLVLVGVGFMPASADPTVTDYPLSQSNADPMSITTGSDGAVWFTQQNYNELGRINSSGGIAEYPFPASGYSDSQSIASGSDGALWFTEPILNKIGRMTTAGDYTEYALPTNAGPQSITSGPDGALWFAEAGIDSIGRITTSGQISQFPLSISGSEPVGITSGPDGALWFTDWGNQTIGRMNTSGSVTEYPLSAGASPSWITSGPDGALWFTEQGPDRIGRITTAGVPTEYSLPATGDQGPFGITAGADGALWFPEINTQRMGRISTSGVITEYPLPSSDTFPAYVTSGPDGALWVTIRNGNKISRVTVPIPPTASTNLTIPSPTQNPSLSWTAVSGANSYNIYRDGVKVDSSATASYTDTTAAEGTHSYDVTAVSSGGESSPSSTVSVLVDRTAPTITYTVTPVADSTGNNTGNVLVTFNCTDNTGGSGIASCTSPITVPDEGVGHVVSGSATDNAGNTTMVNANASLLVSAINAGGNSSGNYASDTGFSGGQAYTSSAAVDTSKITVPAAAPQAVYQSVRYGNTMTYTFSGLTPSASYTLRLHFNEPYWGTPQVSGGVGSRVFNVAVNGQSALTNFDVFATAGGANKAIAEQVPATADASGNVTVTFTTVTDNAMVSGLELYNGALPPAPAPATTPGSTALINAGGEATGSFAADADFSGGQAYSSAATVDTSAVTNPAPQAVYQSDRYGSTFRYSIPNLAPSANYLVRLHFNEAYWGAQASGGIGSRVFNVAINNFPVLNNFDVYKTAGGANKAVIEAFVVPSDANGNMSIQFTSVADNAMVSGVEVTKE